MKYAMITPPYVKYGPLGGYHFVLGQKALRDRAYADKYRELHELGDFIIVDNGAAEPEDGEAAFKLVAEMAEYIGADEVILPDVLKDAESTRRATRAYATYVPPCKRMIVPQGKSHREWLGCMDSMLMDISCTSIGIPKYTDSFEGGRAALLADISKRKLYRTRHIHLLGFVDDDPLLELRMLAHAFPWIRGVDSGAAVAWAVEGKALEEGDKHISLQWTTDKPIGDNTMALINSNFEKIRGYCNAHYTAGSGNES